MTLEQELKAAHDAHLTLIEWRRQRDEHAPHAPRRVAGPRRPPAKRTLPPPLPDGVRRYLEPLAVGERHGDTLNLVLRTVACGKKNNQQTIYRTINGKQQQFRIPGEHYAAFALDVQAGIFPLLKKLQLPLPHIPYSLSCIFFIRNPDLEQRGYDIDNLLNGLLDALEDAGVFKNDRCIRRLHDVGFVLDEANPRIALTLTPLEPCEPT